MNNNTQPKNKKGCGCLMAVAVFAVVFVGMLAVIGGNSDQDDEEIIKTAGVETQQTDAVEKTENNESVNAAEATESKTTEDVGEVILLDDKGVKITAKSLDKSGWLGPELKILIENNSGKTLNVQTRNSSVNGYMVDTSLYEDVADGKKVNSSITFLNSDLKRAGIETIADMEFSFRVTDEDWDEYLETDPIVVKTTAAETYDYTYNMPGDVIYDADGIKIVFSGSTTSDWLGEGVTFYAYNGSDKSINISDQDASVNGFMIDPLLYFEIEPGKYAVENMTFTETDLEENDIDKITDIEFNIRISDGETWRINTESEPIALKFE